MEAAIQRFYGLFDKANLRVIFHRGPPGSERLTGAKLDGLARRALTLSSLPFYYSR